MQSTCLAHAAAFPLQLLNYSWSRGQGGAAKNAAAELPPVNPASPRAHALQLRSPRGAHLCRRSNSRRQMYSLGMLGRHCKGAAAEAVAGPAVWHVGELPCMLRASGIAHYLPAQEQAARCTAALQFL